MLSSLCSGRKRIRIYIFILIAANIAFAEERVGIMLEKNSPEITNHYSTNIQELVSSWQQFLFQNPWHELIKNRTPLKVGCGTVYELPNFLNRPNEDFAIVDMRDILYAEPHYHPENDYEIYFVLQGTAIVVVGRFEHHVKRGDVIVISPNKAHFTIPDENYVLACVNTPPYNPEHFIVLTETNENFEFDKEQFDRLVSARLKI